jgi:hypothetical protein
MHCQGKLIRKKIGCLAYSISVTSHYKQRQVRRFRSRNGALVAGGWAGVVGWGGGCRQGGAEDLGREWGWRTTESMASKIFTDEPLGDNDPHRLTHMTRRFHSSGATWAALP